MLARLCDVSVSHSLRWQFRLIGRIWEHKYPDPNHNERLLFLEKSFMSFLICVRIFSLSWLTVLAKQEDTEAHLTELFVLVRFLILIILLYNPSPSAWYASSIAYLLVGG